MRGANMRRSNMNPFSSCYPNCKPVRPFPVKPMMGKPVGPYASQFPPQPMMDQSAQYMPPMCGYPQQPMMEEPMMNMPNMGPMQLEGYPMNQPFQNQPGPQTQMMNMPNMPDEMSQMNPYGYPGQICSCCGRPMTGYPTNPNY